MNLEQFERHPLTFGPSPVHHLQRLSDHLAAKGGGAPVWMKREDVNSGLAFGGNKTRKLEFNVPDARSRRAPTRSSRSAACSPTTRARSPPSPRTSA